MTTYGCRQRMDWSRAASAPVAPPGPGAGGSDGTGGASDAEVRQSDEVGGRNGRSERQVTELADARYVTTWPWLWPERGNALARASAIARAGAAQPNEL